MWLSTNECRDSTKIQTSHFIAEYKRYKTTTLAMPRQKRKGATAKIADSDFHKDQDRLSSIEENASHKDSTLMEQMQPVKKGKNDHTQKQKKNISLTACYNDSKSDGTKKDGNKGNKPNETDSKSKHKIKKMVDRNCKTFVRM